MENNKINSILVIRLSSLGDILLTTPAVRALKKKYPGAGIDYLIREEYSDLMRYNPHIDTLHKLTRNKDDHKALIDKLSEQNYDMVVDLQNNPRTRRIRNRLGGKLFSFKKHPVKKFLLVKFKINLLHKLPPIPERYIQSVPGLKPDSGGLDLYLPQESDTGLPDEGKWIGLCPGSKHFTKMYPPDYFAELGRNLTTAGYSLALFGGRDDKTICNELSEQIDGSLNLCNDNDIFSTAAGMKKCAAVVCNDSGLMHIACAVGTPVVAIYGSTVRELGFTPYKCDNLLLENNYLSCRPCSHIGRKSCPKGHFKCMLQIKPEEVFRSVEAILNNE